MWFSMNGMSQIIGGLIAVSRFGWALASIG